MRDHEVDRIRRRELGRDREVALVLAILVVDDDDEAALADLLDRLLDGREGALGAGLDCHRHGRMLPGSSFSTYLASTSVSRFTSSPAVELAERRDLERVRDQRHLEARLVDRGDGERDAVHGDRSLLHAVAEQLGCRLDPDADAVRRRVDRGNRSGAVDVALHLVAAEWVSGPERRLDVDAVCRTTSRATTSPARRRTRASRPTASTTVRQTPSIAIESPISAAVCASTTSLPSSKDATLPTSRTSPVNMTRGYGSRRYASRRTSSPTCRLDSRVRPSGSLEALHEARPHARQGRRDEQEQLVDESRLQERSGQRRASLEQQRLDALRGERAQLLLERAGAQLELGALRQRPTPEGQPPGLPLRIDVARVESRILEPHRPHPDRHRVGGRAQLVHEAARCLPRDPALARHGDAARRASSPPCR